MIDIKVLLIKVNIEIMIKIFKCLQEFKLKNQVIIIVIIEIIKINTKILPNQIMPLFKLEQALDYLLVQEYLLDRKPHKSYRKII
jgi:hypothetical protein